MTTDPKQKVRAEVGRAQAKFERITQQQEEARRARREVFEKARKAGMTLREIGEAAGIHWTRVGKVLEKT